MSKFTAGLMGIFFVFFFTANAWPHSPIVKQSLPGNFGMTVYDNGSGSGVTLWFNSGRPDSSGLFRHYPHRPYPGWRGYGNHERFPQARMWKHHHHHNHGFHHHDHVSHHHHHGSHHSHPGGHGTRGHH